jgi:hypothetical protein
MAQVPPKIGKRADLVKRPGARPGGEPQGGGLFLPLVQGQDAGHDDGHAQGEEQDLFELHLARSFDWFPGTIII